MPSVRYTSDRSIAAPVGLWISMNSPSVGVTTTSDSSRSGAGAGGVPPQDVNVPIGNGVVAVAFVVSPSSALGPLNDQLPRVNDVPSGPVPVFR